MAPSVSVLPGQPPATPTDHIAALKAATNTRAKLTSGQYDQLSETVTPYEQYPKQISGPTVWVRDDYQTHPERWVHWWTSEQLAEIEQAARNFQATGASITDISKDNFVLASQELRDFLAAARHDLLEGKGFVLFKGFPVRDWGVELSAIAYTGLGTYFGRAISQNGKGHILGHVKDLGNDPTQIDKVRIYSTNARQFFHADESDLVGLLCMHRAKEGGESDIVSTHHIWNVLQRERPDVARTLTQLWYFDRKGEVSEGKLPWHTSQIFQYYRNRLITKWDPYFVKSLTRFSDKGDIPALSAEQREAAEVLEQTCLREALHMVLEVGDIQIVSNTHVLHSRTAYIDHPAPTPKRQLMRLWLSTPPSEGGIDLPYEDSNELLRGGVQVNDQPHTSPLDAE
ncbi:hypothetical protein PYCC9005_001966 [Savitreella phatthalungensis]